MTYDPGRLRGISAYRQIEREFATGDRIQVTAPNRDLQVANRDLGTLKSFNLDGRITLLMDSGRDVSFDPNEMRHFDHGYAITSHSSQGLTSERVLVNTHVDRHNQLLGPIRLTSAFIDHLKSRQGIIIYNTSVLAFVPLAMTAVYSATKAALHS